jgi:hypothetical protein
MPLGFPKSGNSANFVGQTPWSARVPQDPPVRSKNQRPAQPNRPARGPAADEGVRPTNHAGTLGIENYVALS